MKALVIEDSRLARQGLVRMLEKFPSVEVVGEAEDAEIAMELIDAQRPELLFLDIHMPGASGFELLANLDYTPKIIFTTAYSEYAIKSFDFNTVDYLLKPISHDRLSIAIQKLEDTAPANEDDISSANESALDMNSKIFVKDGDNCHLVELAKIHYIESCKNYVRIFFDEGKAFVKKSLSQVEARLPPQYFFRASRQYLVNLNAITEISEAISDGYEVKMKDGEVIEVSRRNASRMKELLSL